MDAKINLSVDLMNKIKNMDFGSALTFLKDGYLVRRQSWKKGYMIKLNDNKIFAYDTEYGTNQEWDIENNHILAEDWEFYTDHILDATAITTGNITMITTGNTTTNGGK